MTPEMPDVWERLFRKSDTESRDLQGSKILLGFGDRFQLRKNRYRWDRVCGIGSQFFDNIELKTKKGQFTVILFLHTYGYLVYLIGGLQLNVTSTHVIEKRRPFVSCN